MAPMRTPAPLRDPAIHGALTIDAYARRHGMTPREVRRLLGTGQLPFVQIRGQIRIAADAVISG